MNHQTRACTLSLTDIAPEHCWSLHQDLTLEPDEEFLDRVRRHGLLHPLLVRSWTQGSYQLICGSLRLKALEMLGVQQTACLLLPPTLDTAQIIELVARDQSETGPLSPIEAARLVVLAQSHGLDVLEICRSFTGITNRAQCRRLPLVLQLEPPLRVLIHRGVVSTRVGLTLGSLAADDRLFLGALFQELELNDNKQQRIIDWGRIIATTEKLSFRDLFADRYGYCLKTDETANRPQIIHRLLQDLQKDSHPRLSQAQQAFEDRLAALHLPPSCQVSPTISFESDRVTLSVELSSLAELESLWPPLRTLLEK